MSKAKEKYERDNKTYTDLAELEKSEPAVYTVGYWDVVSLVTLDKVVAEDMCKRLKRADGLPYTVRTVREAVSNAYYSYHREIL